MKCAYCGLEKLSQGIKYPVYVVIKNNKKYYFCSKECFIQWAMREK
jgi:ribosomal protein L24E